MRTTLNLRTDIVSRASKLTGISHTSTLVHAGLEALIARESARMLVAMGGTMPDFPSPVRRRMSIRRARRKAR